MIADISVKMDLDLPAKIQCLVAQITNEYFEDARFGLPDDSTLNCNSIKRDILRNTANLTLLPPIRHILHPAAKPTSQRSKPHVGSGLDRNKDRQSLQFDQH